MGTLELRVWLCGFALVVGCGRTEIWSGLEGGDTGGTRAGRAGSGVAGSGGGSSGVGGMAPAGAGAGGTFVSGVAGNSGEGGLGGRLQQHAELFATDVMVTALGAAPDGRVAMGGIFEGSLAIGGQVLTSYPEGAAFVAVFDAEARLQWARMVLGERGGRISGLAFTPDGAVVAAGATDRQFAVRFDEKGGLLWRQDFGGHLNDSSKVVVDQKGDAWVGGWLDQPLAVGRRTASNDGAAYLLSLNAAGELVDAMKVLPEACAASELADLAADDEGRLIVVGTCGARSQAFLQKRDMDGTVSFERRITGTFDFSLGLVQAAVDHAGRITIGTTIRHSLQDGEGGTVLQAPDSAQDLWFAQYSPGGDRLWQRTYSTDVAGITIAALEADPSGNILALGNCSELRFGQMEIISRSTRVSSPPNYILKLRPDGTPAWGHVLEGGMSVKSMTTDATDHVWVGGTFTGQTWLGDQMVVGNATRAGLVLRLSP